MRNTLILKRFVVAATAVYGSFVLSGCMQPADEILKNSDQVGKIVFVKQNSIGRNHNIAMAANPDEFYSGTDIYSLSPISPSGTLTNLTAPYTRGSFSSNEWGAAEDPEISYDGKKMLFSMRKAGARQWNIYELSLETGVLTQLTENQKGDDMDPAYLPDGNIAFTSTRNQISDEYERRIVPQLFLGLRGSKAVESVRQLSFNQSHDQNPFVQSSGVIVYTRWDHLGNPNKMPLFSIHPDGTRQFVYYGADETFSGTETSGMRTFMEARELADGGIVSSMMERTSAFEGGSICIVDLANGMKAKPQIITPTPYNFEGRGMVADALFKTPYPIMDKGKERILVAQSTHDVGGSSNGDANFDLFVMDKDGSNMQIVHLDPNYNDYDPVVVAPHTAPKILPTDSNVARGLAIGMTTGFFFDASVYNRDRSLDGQLVPTQGQVKYLRVLEGIPLPRGQTTGTLGETGFEKQRVVGYANVETDGSFAIEVPSQKSLHVQSLDENGLMLVNQLQWIHVQPGEQRICTGCHGAREHDADINSFKVGDSGVVTSNAGGDVKSYLARFSQAQQVWKHSAAKTDTVDFYDPQALSSGTTPTKSATVQAVLDRNCVSCHSIAAAKDSGGGLILEENPPATAAVKENMNRSDAVSSVYARLTNDSGYQSASKGKRAYATDNGARNSPLAWVLYNKQLNGSSGDFRTSSFDHSTLWKKDSSGNIPPFDAANADLLTLIEWMDMGIQFSNSNSSISNP